MTRQGTTVWMNEWIQGNMMDTTQYNLAEDNLILGGPKGKSDWKDSREAADANQRRETGPQHLVNYCRTVFSCI